MGIAAAVSVDYEANERGGNGKFSGHADLGSAAVNNQPFHFGDLSIGEFGRFGPLADLRVTAIDRMIDVLRMRDPLKILEAVVVLVEILVIYLGKGLGIFNERFGNESVQQAMHKLPPDLNVGANVSGIIHPSPECSPRATPLIHGARSHEAGFADLVLRVNSFYLSPIHTRSV